MDNPGNTDRKDKTCVFPTTTFIFNVKGNFAEVSYSSDSILNAAVIFSEPTSLHIYDDLLAG